MPDRPHRILFVCMGNICRSPMARWIMIDLCEKHNALHEFEIDSCGTGAWHAGEGADPRSALCGAKYGLRVDHTARQLRSHDLAYFDHILVMDQRNLRDIATFGQVSSKVKLLRSFDPTAMEEMEVPDPYYGGEQGFEVMYQMLRRACEGLFRTIRTRA